MRVYILLPLLTYLTSVASLPVTDVSNTHDLGPDIDFDHPMDNRPHPIDNHDDNHDSDSHLDNRGLLRGKIAEAATKPYMITIVERAVPLEFGEPNTLRHQTPRFMVGTATDEIVAIDRDCGWQLHPYYVPRPPKTHVSDIAGTKTKEEGSIEFRGGYTEPYGSTLKGLLYTGARIALGNFVIQPAQSVFTLVHTYYYNRSPIQYRDPYLSDTQVTDHTHGADGILGLGFGKTAAWRNFATSKVFGLGFTGRTDGYLTMGGWDKDVAAPENVTWSKVVDEDRWITNMGITDVGKLLLLGGPTGTTTALFDTHSDHITTSDHDLFVKIYASLAKQGIIKLARNTHERDGPEFGSILFQCLSGRALEKLSVTFDFNGFPVTIRGGEFQRKYLGRGYDSYCTGVLRYSKRPSEGADWVMGFPFLRQVYSIFDADRKRIGLHPWMGLS